MRHVKTQSKNDDSDSANVTLFSADWLPIKTFCKVTVRYGVGFQERYLF